MYEYISGDLIEVSPTHAVVLTYGVAYYINITLETYSEIQKSRSATLYVHQHVREDVNALYGFATKEERQFFRLLISVSGIGPASATKALASAPWLEIAQLIANGDPKGFRGIKGIGPKTAANIITSIQDKIELEANQSTVKIDVKIIDDAAKALAALGFPKVKANKLCETIFTKDPTITVEQLIKQAIKAI